MNFGFFAIVFLTELLLWESYYSLVNTLTPYVILKETTIK